jgi:hypothetical protein
MTSFLEAKHALVFIHIGTQLPSYIEDALHQARLFNETCPIYVAASQQALNGLSPKARQARPIEVPLETLQKTQKHDQFLQNSPLDRAFWGGFWLFTTERFFYLEEVIAKYQLENVFHLENDNLLYVDLTQLLPIFTKHYEGIGATLDNDDRCIPGFVYIRNQKAISSLTQFLADFAHTGKTDMQFLAAFRQRAQKEEIDHLPIIMQSYFHAHPGITKSGIKVQNPFVFANHQDDFQSVFDAAALGQYLGGTDARVRGKRPNFGFVNESCVFNPSLLFFHWLTDEKNRKVPYIEFKGKMCRINNLHMHSKHLSPYCSD